MRNLEILQVKSKLFTEPSLVAAQCFHITSKEVFYTSGSSLFKYDRENEKTSEIFCADLCQVRAIKFLAIEQKICVVTADCFYIVNPSGTNECLNAPLEEKCSAIAWSPGEELVAMVTTSGTVKTYVVNYEEGLIFERGTSSIEASIPDTVYVGWGSKETQFRGTEGKYKKDTVPEKIEPINDKQPIISWRGNGEMFAVNYWTENKRRFVVFQTPCVAQFRSEDLPGLQAPIAWRPTGNMIATIAKVKDCQQVVIFEKNGQKRFHFNVDFKDSMVVDMKWSPCAQILTLLTRAASGIKTLHLLTSSNYHWYEKQRLIFESDDLLAYDWSTSTRFTFVLDVMTSRHSLTYKFRRHVTASGAICAVIDGTKLLMTDFDRSIIPPPMSLSELISKSAINFVAINGNLVCLVDTNEQVSIYDWSTEGAARLFQMDLGKKFDVLYPLACNRFYWTNEKRIAFTREGCQYEIDIESGDINLCHSETVTDNIQIVEKTINDRLYTFTLTDACHLFLDDDRLSDVTSSFVIKEDYLITTTRLNELYCARLSDLTKQAKLDENRKRWVEQGAILIAAISASPKVVLQMPRGNLETISLRLISIDTLNRLLNEDAWVDALKFLRLEKLNANLLFDLNPERFLEKIRSFIAAAQELNELGNFCLELENYNVLDTLYKNWGSVESYPDKVKTICRALLTTFDDLGYVPYITPIMLINLHHFNLCDALIYIQDLWNRSQEDVQLKAPLQLALHTLKMYDCNQEQLYTESLLLYDLNLARFIAANCQMDPRVYEPQLHTLDSLPEVERRYHVNVYAKRPSIAVAYLLRMSGTSSEQIRTFVVNNRVERAAYERCPETCEHYRTICNTFAEHLSRKGCHRESAVIYRKAGESRLALEQYKMALDWQWVVRLSEKDDLERNCAEMAERLVRHDRFRDAAMVHEHHLGDPRTALKILVDRHIYPEALDLARRCHLEESIQTDLIPSLLRHKSDLEDKLTVLLENIRAHTERLSQLRKSKVDRTEGSHGNEPDDLFSDAGSVSSRTSRSRHTSASSRNRRKMARKKQDLRKGGQYEDIALIRALHLTIRELWYLKDDVSDVCTLLIQESSAKLSQIRTLYDLYREVDKEAESKTKEIWPSCFQAVAGQPLENPDDRWLLENLEHLDLEYRTPPTGGKPLSLAFFDDPSL